MNMKKKLNAVAGIQPAQESRVAQEAVEKVAPQPAMPTHPILKESGDQPGAGKLFGYIRVSSREQNEARQVVALHSFGITDDHIFLDKQSGKDFNRPAYQALLRQLNAGDVLVVKSIDLLPLPQWPLCRHDRQNPDRGSGPHRRGEDKILATLDWLENQGKTTLGEGGTCYTMEQFIDVTRPGRLDGWNDDTILKFVEGMELTDDGEVAVRFKAGVTVTVEIPGRRLR